MNVSMTLSSLQRAHGFLDLVFDVVDETSHLVERTHDAVVDRSARRFARSEPARSAARVVTTVQTAISGRVFASIRAINGVTRRAVNTTADVAMEGLDATSGVGDISSVNDPASDTGGRAGRYVDALESSLNGFWGDYLSRESSRLDLGMTIRHQGRPLPLTSETLAAAFPNPTDRVCVFVHGLAATERLWSKSSEEHYGDPDVTFGSRLSVDLGFTPLYLRYNTGCHISENGRALAALLTELQDAYPVAIEEIVLVGHSMGGLVARSAAYYAKQHMEPWVASLRHVVCIGSPHLGAPLEKAVSLVSGVLKKIDAAGAQVPAQLLDSRSAGIKDLRYGYTVDEEWAGKDPDQMLANSRRNVPFVDGVGYYFVAATVGRDLNHPLGRVLGDLLVRLPSASGEGPRPAHRMDFDDGAVFPGMNHIQVANHPDVYDALLPFLSR